MLGAVVCLGRSAAHNLDLDVDGPDGIQVVIRLTLVCSDVRCLVLHRGVGVEFLSLAVVPEEVNLVRNSRVGCVLLRPADERVAFIREGVGRLDHNARVVRNVISGNGCAVLERVLVGVLVGAVVRIPRDMRVGLVVLVPILGTEVYGIRRVDNDRVIRIGRRCTGLGIRGFINLVSFSFWIGSIRPLSHDDLCVVLLHCEGVAGEHFLLALSVNPT